MIELAHVLTLLASHRPVRDDEETARLCSNPEQEKRVVVNDDDMHASLAQGSEDVR